MSESFGQLVRRHRTAAGLSQAELGNLAGLHASAIGHIECGRRKQVHPRTVRVLIQALRLSESDETLLRQAAESNRDASPQSLDSHDDEVTMARDRIRIAPHPQEGSGHQLLNHPRVIALIVAIAACVVVAFIVRSLLPLRSGAQAMYPYPCAQALRQAPVYEQPSASSRLLVIKQRGEPITLRRDIAPRYNPSEGITYRPVRTPRVAVGYAWMDAGDLKDLPSTCKDYAY